MIVQLVEPFSSLLLQQGIVGKEECVMITQIRNVHFTKIEEFDAYFNDLNSKGPNPLRRIEDSSFVIVPLRILKELLGI
jgi:hypothetical protein